MCNIPNLSYELLARLLPGLGPGDADRDDDDDDDDERDAGDAARYDVDHEVILEYLIRKCIGSGVKLGIFLPRNYK
jgi:hypothetical protein